MDESLIAVGAIIGVISYVATMMCMFSITSSFSKIAKHLDKE